MSEHFGRLDHHTGCKCPTFLQSRNLPHLLANEWRDALFDLLTTRPLDTIYSIAFTLSFAYSYGLSSTDDLSNRYRVSTFEVMRELYDLLDDYVTMRATNMNERITIEEYVQVNSQYRTEIEPLLSFVERYLPERRRPVGGGGGDGDGDDVTVDLLPEHRIAMVKLFRELNELTILPLFINGSGSLVTRKFDLDVVSHSDYATLSQPLTAATDAAATDAAATGTAAAHPAWSYMEMYVWYSYALARYHALQSLARKVTLARGVNILPLLMPSGSAWQAGMSQMLWVLLHTICALSVSRGNVFVQRLLLLLHTNLPRFIWCGECAAHWSMNSGAEYFRAYVRSEPRENIPMDMLLAHCHNMIAANSRLNRRVSAWTLGQIVLDYREFVERLLLRRRPNVCARYGCPQQQEPSHFFMRPIYADEYVTVRTVAPADLMHQARGEWLLNKLWREVDREQRMQCIMRP